MRHSLFPNLRKTAFMAAAIFLLSALAAERSRIPAADISLGVAVPTVSPGAQVKSIEVDAETRARIEENYGKLPLSFEVNNGQVDEAVRFQPRAITSSATIRRSAERTCPNMQRSKWNKSILE